jgi:hypothetical protein
MDTDPTQLPLLSPEPERASPWRLDDRTKAVNRAGIAEARAILTEAARRAAERQEAA